MTHRYEIEADLNTLNLPLCVSSGQVFRWREVSARSWLGADGPHWYHVVIVDSGPNGSSRLRVESNAPEAAFRALFRMGVDLPVLQQQFVEAMPELAPMIHALPGLRLMAPTDPVEVLTCFACTVNNHLPRIGKMVDRLAARGPILTTVEGVTLPRFPPLETVASLSEQELRMEGFGYRSATVPRIAREILDRGGAAWLDALATRPYPAAFEALSEIPGIGPKLADCICLFALHHTEAVPVDTHLWKAAIQLFFPHLAGCGLTRRRYQAVGDLFRSRHGKWAGWAHQYLFYHHLVNWRRR
jgi:N-glycosylase/DNA lyase